MTSELTWLAWSAVLTAALWIPYIANLLASNRLKDAVGYPDEPPKMAAWAERLKAAHYNSVENLVVFAALVLVADAAGIANEATATAAATYFWARLVHAIAYTGAIPWIRTLSFAAAWLAMICIAWHIFAA